MTTVREMMTTDPLVLPASTPMTEAAQRMREKDIGDVLVDSDGTLGIATDRDLVVRGVADGSLDRTLGDLATFDLETVRPNDELEEVIRDMRSDAIRRVPVVEDGTAIGILSIGDLAVARDQDSALADISAAPGNN